MPTAATASRRRRLELLRPSGWFVPDHDMDGAHLSSGLTVTVDVTAPDSVVAAASADTATRSRRVRSRCGAWPDRNLSGREKRPGVSYRSWRRRSVDRRLAGRVIRPGVG